MIPIRFAFSSIAQNGTLCYGYNGQIWTKPSDAEPQQVMLDVVADERDNPVQLTTLTSGATEISVSPQGAEDRAGGARRDLRDRRGVWQTKRVTSTPQQERSVVWGPDGRTLYYASERDGSWNLYKTTITCEDEDRFATATLLTEDVVLQDENETFQPLLSPDGKKLAYLHNRDEIRVLDVSTRKSSRVLAADRNYSDAHMFPHAYKQLHLGKLVGTPVPGTGTAVWWESQIDPSIVFGIPQVGMVTPEGKYLESFELTPDVEVYNTPESVASGQDRQIAKAVQVLLDELKK